MATTKTDAQKVAELRKQAMDKSLPQEVRDMADKKANEIEGKSVEKSTGMKLAKGGAVVAKAPAKKAAPKKFAMGGVVAKPGSPRIVARQMPRDQRANAAAAGKPYSMMSAGKEQSQIAAAQKMFDAGPQGAAQKQAPTGKPLPNLGAVPKKMAKGGAVKKAKK